MKAQVREVQPVVMSASAVARALDLHTWEVRELEPEGFGAPRDRGWNGQEDVYTEHGIGLLVAALHARGEDLRSMALQEAWLATAHGASESVEPWYRKGAME